jgi:holo-[acyl-carrier protein] synthase
MPKRAAACTTRRVFRRALSETATRPAAKRGGNAGGADLLPATYGGLRVGIDVISVAEVRDALDRFGDRYVRRTFTDHEAAYCRRGAPAVAAARFAARFAAKEAVVKALQPRQRWSDWSAIEIRRHQSGRCDVRLHREAAALARRRGVDYLAVSMTHDGDRAAAIAVALPNPLSAGPGEPDAT